LGFGIVPPNVFVSFSLFNNISSPSIPDGGSSVMNPSYSFWIRQDKPLYITLLGLCDVKASVVVATTDTHDLYYNVHFPIAFTVRLIL